MVLSTTEKNVTAATHLLRSIDFHHHHHHHHRDHIHNRRYRHQCGKMFKYCLYLNTKSAEKVSGKRI